MKNNIKPIGCIYTDFGTKFGVPRQSGLAGELRGRIVFEKEYAREEAFRGLEEFSHIWVIWSFSENEDKNISLTVRPPRLGGNRRKGVFATRSPFRPNSMGLSCVKLEKIENTAEQGIVLYVSGIDMMNGTPVFDIKPYVPVTDCVREASGGFTEETKKHFLIVDIDEELLNILPQEKRNGALQMLALDPRPSYIEDESRIYGVEFCGHDIRFTVNGNVLKVIEIL